MTTEQGIDAHQHFWRYTPQAYPWIDSTMARLRRDFGPADLTPCLHAAGLAGSVAVQASATVAETEWLLSLADQHPGIEGVVGWVDLCAADVRTTLERLAAHPRFRGVRHIVQDEPDDWFLLREDFLGGVALLGELDLTYDILIFPRQLPAALEFVRRHPRHRLVLDHLAKPPVRAGTLEPWASQVRALARSPNLVCKVSGLVTEASWTSWTRDDLTPYLDVVLEAFGPDRLMFGSDWPVCLLAAEYADVAGVVREFVSTLSVDEQQAVFGGTARRVYRLEERGRP